MRLRSRHEEAVGIARSSEESQEQEERARAALDAARRASVVVPLARHAQETATAVERAQRALGQALADAARLLDTDAAALTQGDLEVAERDATEAATIARTLLPREAELQRAERDAARVTRTLSRLAEERTGLDQRCTTIPGAGRRAAHPADRAGHARRRGRDARGRRAGRDRAARRSAPGDVAACRPRGRRRAAAGEHRRRAAAPAAVPGPPRGADQRHGRRARRLPRRRGVLPGVRLRRPPAGGALGRRRPDQVRRGARPHRVRERRVRPADPPRGRRDAPAEPRRGGPRERRAVGGRAPRRAGGPPERRAASAAAASERDRLATSVADLEAELADAIARLQQLAADEARLRAERDHAQAVVESVSAELSALFAEDEVAGSVSRLIEARTAAGTAFGMAREALAARDRATTQAQGRAAARRSAPSSTASPTPPPRPAPCWPRRPRPARQLLRERDALRAQSRATLADAEVTAAVAADTPDLAALAEAARRPRQPLTDVAAPCPGGADARRTAGRAGAGAGPVARGLGADPCRLRRRLRPVDVRRGQGRRQPLQMRLSAYVLASRPAAGRRGGQRAAARHERRALHAGALLGARRGRARGGLSLLVRDEWTGESRDPATLSGGETFVTSLALALGTRRRGHPGAGGSPSTRSSSTRASARSTPRRSTT